MDARSRQLIATAQETSADASPAGRGGTGKNGDVTNGGQRGAVLARGRDTGGARKTAPAK